MGQLNRGIRPYVYLASGRVAHVYLTYGREKAHGAARSPGHRRCGGRWPRRPDDGERGRWPRHRRWSFANTVAGRRDTDRTTDDDRATGGDDHHGGPGDDDREADPGTAATGDVRVPGRGGLRRQDRRQPDLGRGRRE